VDVIVEFNKAAFRHGIGREDILHVLKTKIYAALIEELPEKYIVIGFDRAGNPLKLCIIRLTITLLLFFTR
jgi:hypothetical protein